MIQKELYERIYSDGNTVSEILRRLERKGWMRRTPHEADGRATRVAITSKGEAVRRRVFSVARRIHRRALAGFADRERDQFFEYLTRVFESVEAGGNRK